MEIKLHFFLHLKKSLCWIFEGIVKLLDSRLLEVEVIWYISSLNNPHLGIFVS